METRKEKTSLTKAADPVFVSMFGDVNTSSGSVAFGGLENGAVMPEGSSAKSYLLSAAEVKDRLTPVASGETYFRFMAEAARDQGYITQQGLEHVMAALYPEANHA